ncbi:MAG: Tol-Pal system beta propeller repeat protein TolB, partial [Oceanobacter sp.]
MVIRFILYLCLLTASQISYAELVIEVTQGKQSAIPIAVMPFSIGSDTVNVTDNIADIVSNDLASSGYFRLLDKQNIVKIPGSESEINYSDWRYLGQDFLVLGRVEQAASSQSYVVEFNVHDIHQKKSILKYRVKGKDGQLRDIAHYISDYIFKKLTGIEGVFSTKLIYVTTNKKRTRFNLNYADADGAREQLIFSSKEPIISPAWSPDGKTVAYVSFESGQSEIYFQELATGNRKLILNLPYTTSGPSFSPDGKKLAFVYTKLGNPDIYVLDLKSGQIEPLTSHYAIDTEPQWMSDNRHLVFTSSRSGTPQVYRLDSQTKEVKRITFEGNYNARPRLTQDNRKLVYVHKVADSFHIASQDMASG